jgi:hypothetical protein
MKDRSETVEMAVISGTRSDSGPLAYLNSTSRSRIARTPESAAVSAVAVGAS